MSAVEKPADVKVVEEKPMVEDEKDYYAWAQIPYNVKVDEKSGTILSRDLIKPGDKVSAKMLGIDDDEFALLIATKSVRKKKYPETKVYEAPKRALIRKAKEDMDSALAGGD